MHARKAEDETQGGVAWGPSHEAEENRERARLLRRWAEATRYLCLRRTEQTAGASFGSGWSIVSMPPAEDDPSPSGPPGSSGDSDAGRRGSSIPVRVGDRPARLEPPPLDWDTAAQELAERQFALARDVARAIEREERRFGGSAQ